MSAEELPMLRPLVLSATTVVMLIACQQSGPCATEGAVRKDGLCDCPDGARIEDKADGSGAHCVTATLPAAGEQVDAGRDSGERDQSQRVPTGASSPFEDAAMTTANDRDASTTDAAACETATAGCHSGAGCADANACDGTSNGCPNATNGLNACGGCEVLAHPVDTACDNGLKGECAATGVYRCTSSKESVTCSAPLKSGSSEVCNAKDDDCNGVIDDGAKTECGMPCGSVCPPPSVCGDGVVSSPEECDLNAAGTSDLTCTAQCKRKTMYRPCATNSDCSALQGETCDTTYAFCTKPCSLAGALGANSGCPAPGGKLTAQCASFAKSVECVSVGCVEHTDCGPGASCVGAGMFAYCMGCDRPQVCSSGSCMIPSGGTFGVCK